MVARPDETGNRGAMRIDGEISSLCALLEQGEPLPYEPLRTELYTVAELDREVPASDSPTTAISADLAIYNHFVAQGRSECDLVEALAQRIHDWAIDEALGDVIDGFRGSRIVGIMGGHGAARHEAVYAAAAEAAWRVSRSGSIIASGGGPGVMEAANLGAWCGDHDIDVVHQAIATLSNSPGYADHGYRDAANEVLAQTGDGRPSIAIPTWFYGHEPSNVFSGHIAKYFSNSIREDRLLAICKGGIVFAPGSAGTAQEVFQDAAQNHYETFGPPSPMVFLGVEHWRATGLWEAATIQAGDKPYRKLMTLVDSPEEAAAFLDEHGHEYTGA